MSNKRLTGDTPVSQLQFPRHGHRIRPMMDAVGIKTLGDFNKFSEMELQRTPNFGPASLAELKRVLSEAGHSLRQ